MKYFLIILLCVSCSSLNTSSSQKQAGPEDLIAFEQAFENLGQGFYNEAQAVFEKLALKYKGFDIENAALFNLASAYKELKKCEKAEAVYKKLLKNKAPANLIPRIYLDMSYTYECLGRAEETLLALKQGLQYDKHLPPETKLIEYPARLSLAYFRMNESKIGQELQKNVYKNLEVLKKSFQIQTAGDKNFSKYFYIMGNSHITSRFIKLDSFLRAFPYYQVYLSQALLLSQNPWSAKAEAALGGIYRKLWQSLKKEKNKSVHKQSIKNILNEFRNIARNGQDKKINKIYLTIRRKTLTILNQ